MLINLLDFSGNILSGNVTVKSLFEMAKVTRLRIYFCTKPKCETVTSEAINETELLPEAASWPSPQPPTAYLLEGSSGAQDRVELIDSENINNMLVHHGLTVRGFNCTIENTEGNNSLDEFLTIAHLGENRVSVEEQLQSNQNAYYMRDTSEPAIQLKLHRGQVFEELIAIFSECDLTNEGICVQVILPNGDLGLADDLGGVWRDALSEFWEAMLQKCMVGRNVKIPQIRHDFDNTRWTAIGRIGRNNTFLYKFPKRFLKYVYLKKRTAIY